ncbi:MAG TPA: EamA family transporter [Candidatus Saccharimonadales bacterium]|nr:EamA family transporter [Candidatus Saccharimonadales bacterium]
MIYIVLAMIIYSVAIMFATAASRHANTNIATAIMNSVSGIIPIIIAVPLLSKKTLQNEKAGVMFAVITGILLGIFVLTINKAYAHNKVGIVAPVVFGGAIFLSTLFSYFIYKEKVGGLQFIGLVFLAIGFGTILYARATVK